MVQTPEDINRKKGSIIVKATGTVSALMMRELDCMVHKSQAFVSGKRKHLTVPVSVSCGVSTKRLQPRTSSHSAGRSASMNNSTHRRPRSSGTKKHNPQYTALRVPMLGSEDISIDRTPNRRKPEKKGSHFVEIVDLDCGNPDRICVDALENPLPPLYFFLGARISILVAGMIR
ncbi:hypothetical protein F0562_031915 [Nyssa sinensis]|uniref:Uncharacterized protein n=1 Tax=Nyssa sinensis TaxID=561372 RepID=A0A5J5AVQ8_9ASTE|nr:hypothetical protein F0562_031915 [Nyssa sinensis]